MRATYNADYDTFQTNAGDVILFFEGDKNSDNNAGAAIQIVKKTSETHLK
jgi:hypothetical protein